MRKLLVGAMSLALGLTALMAAPVAAKDKVCKDESIYGGTIVGDVKIPAGKYCHLYGVTVRGDVKAGEDAATGIYNTSLVEGDVKGKDGSMLWVGLGSTVKGSVRADKAAGLTVSGAKVEGDVQAAEVAYGPYVVDSTIDGNLQFERSGFMLPSGPYFPLEVSGNTVGGNCQGKGNTLPIISYGNVVTGKIKGQCNCVAGC